MSNMLLAALYTLLIEQKLFCRVDYTLKGKKAPYLTENDPKRRSEIRDSTSRGNDIESKTVLEAPRSPLKPLSGSQEYNISLNQEKAQNTLKNNFIILSH